MKNDLASSIGVAILGVLIAYFVTGLFISKIEDVTIKTVDPNLNIELASPNPNVFNYKALNPTVEVYVGECTEDDESEACKDTNNEENPEDQNQEND